MKYKISRWNQGISGKWNYTLDESVCQYIVYKIDKVPDFSSPKFIYLGEKVDDRSMEVVQKQLQMLRHLHDLGTNWGCSLRIVKAEEGLNLYLVFRYSGIDELSREETLKIVRQIELSFPKEYTINKVEEESSKDAIDTSWAKYSGEIFKEEKTYHGNAGEYYSFPQWVPISNDMDVICRALSEMHHKALIEITLIPTVLAEDEKEWMNIYIQHLKRAQSGETFKDDVGKTVIKCDPIPVLKTPIEHFEKLLKRFDYGRLFLSSIRIFGEVEIEGLGSSLITGSVKNHVDIKTFQVGSPEFKIHKDSYMAVDISPEVRTGLTSQFPELFPFRAQRLRQLVDTEEISNFFRLPIPISAGFPGFGLDTGLGSQVKKKVSNLQIKLGNYIDHVGEPVAQFDSQQLAKHGLIVGVPGSGKTTAMFNILHQLWNGADEDRIPFIVMEPAKTEFRALKTIPHFKDDLLVFTLGDERISPFRFNPFEVLTGVTLESHISRLNACFVGAFNLFDPLPLLLDQAIRRTYMEKGWYEDSMGGEAGVESPTLSDLCRNTEYIVNHSGYDSKMINDFKASLLQRLDSLRRGSKGRMLDTEKSIPMEELMEKPVILELDALNEDEKALMMMFVLSYVYEYCKVKRKSGSPLKHVLLVEEAHNLIGSLGSNNDNRANPKQQTINLVIKMLAEMRALGQGILIADQLPTAIAPQAVKQTNLKVMMRITSKDDREEMGNTMDLSEAQMKDVVRFKIGQALIYHEETDTVQFVQMNNYKEFYNVEEPPSDNELSKMMAYYEKNHSDLYLPYKMCYNYCEACNRRTRNQAEQFNKFFWESKEQNSHFDLIKGERQIKNIANPLKGNVENVTSKCSYFIVGLTKEKKRIASRYGEVGDVFCECSYIHFLEKYSHLQKECKQLFKKCDCRLNKREENFAILKKI